jgi:hypothetical protein
MSPNEASYLFLQTIVALGAQDDAGTSLASTQKKDHLAHGNYSRTAMQAATIDFRGMPELNARIIFRGMLERFPFK